MTIHYEDKHATVWHGDCVNVLTGIPDDTFDAVITDPPYGLTNRTVDVMGCENCGRTLGGNDGAPENCPRCGGKLSRQRSVQGKGFMSKSWDGTGVAFDPATWRAVLRVLKPGGHLVAFGGTRTWHRLVCAIEDAGFEVRDSVAWLYGSGFPKSLNVSKAIDKAAGAEREIVRPRTYGLANGGGYSGGLNTDQPCSATAEISAPATPEVQQWAGYGTAMKPGHEPICVARKPLDGTVAGNVLEWGTGAINIDAMRIEGDTPQPFGSPRKSVGGILNGTDEPREQYVPSAQGRWPANVALDEETAAALQRGFGDTGGPSRFFYTSKAPSSERVTIDGVSHVTVKPLDLMQWLIRGYCPADGLILDPFAGSGTTGEAAIAEGFRAVLIEQDPTYLPLIKARITRRTNPVQHLQTIGEDLGLFGLD